MKGLILAALMISVTSAAAAYEYIEVAAAHTATAVAQAEAARITANRDDLASSLADAVAAKSRIENDKASLMRDWKALNDPYRRTEPVMAIWSGYPFSMTALEASTRHYVAWGLPDTFTVTFNFTSTTPTTVRIMTLTDYACFHANTCSWSVAQTLGPTTFLKDAMFHEAEGCAGYVSIWTTQGAGTVYPDVWGQRNAAPKLTGYCERAEATLSPPVVLAPKLPTPAATPAPTSAPFVNWRDMFPPPNQTIVLCDPYISLCPRR